MGRESMREALASMKDCLFNLSSPEPEQSPCVGIGWKIFLKNGLRIAVTFLCPVRPEPKGAYKVEKLDKIHVQLLFNNVMILV